MPWLRGGSKRWRRRLTNLYLRHFNQLTHPFDLFAFEFILKWTDIQMPHYVPRSLLSFCNTFLHTNSKVVKLLNSWVVGECRGNSTTTMSLHSNESWNCIAYSFLTLVEKVALWEMPIQVVPNSMPTQWLCLGISLWISSQESQSNEVHVQVDRVHYIIPVKDLPSKEARQVELTLFRRRPEEAKSIPLQSGLTHWAISLNLWFFN